KGRLTLGGLFAFNTYVAYVLGSANGLISMNFSFQSFRVAVSRIEEILGETDDVESITDPVSVPAPSGQIRYEDVCFSYANDDLALKNVNLKIRAGERVALVGQSGAGKTTLVALLLRFYVAQRGRILVDSVDIREINPAQLR